jgi:IclR family pca regulon transcriptional regulator
MSQDIETLDSQPTGGIDEARSAYVSAFARGLSVIRCFSHDQPTLTIADVARATNLNRATARRFLHTLEAEGYVSSENGRYSLRPAVLELGYAYLSTLSIDDLFQKQLQELAEQVHESCSAGALDGHDVVFVARAQTSFPRVMTLALAVGARIPAYLTALGRVLLAGLSADELDAYLRTAELRQETERTIADPKRLRQAIDEVRAQGFCIMDQEIETGVCAVAVPVRRPNRPLLAISVAAHSTVATIEQFREVHLPALQKTAAEIEHVLQLPH